VSRPRVAGTPLPFTHGRDRHAGPAALATTAPGPAECLLTRLGRGVGVADGHLQESGRRRTSCAKVEPAEPRWLPPPRRSGGWRLPVDARVNTSVRRVGQIQPTRTRRFSRLSGAPGSQAACGSPRRAGGTTGSATRRPGRSNERRLTSIAPPWRGQLVIGSDRPSTTGVSRILSASSERMAQKTVRRNHRRGLQEHRGLGRGRLAEAGDTVRSSRPGGLIAEVSRAAPFQLPFGNLSRGSCVARPRGPTVAAGTTPTGSP
jgi:hypothetical protein